VNRQQLVKRALPAVGLLTLGLLLLFAEWIRRAPSAEDPRGDAVVVHAGQGERLGHAFDLMEQGAAPTLVIMFGEQQRGVDRFCGRTEPFEVICPTPALATTIGEAVELGRLVEQRGWTTVITVTSNYHLRRATYLDGKCGKVDAIGSGAGQGITRPEAAQRIAREMGGMVQAWFTSC
jgi:hypothetical protein